MTTSFSRVFGGKLHVHYGQAYVFVGDVREWDGDLGDCFFPQKNGICGTAWPGVIFLITGLHTGSVSLTVEISEDAPTDTDEWEDVVEAPFWIDEVAADEGVRLEDWGVSASVVFHFHRGHTEFDIVRVIWTGVMKSIR